MITRQEKLISAALLLALSVLARSAGAAVIPIPTSATEYTIFAGGNLTVGITDPLAVGSIIKGTVGAGGDVTIGDYVTITDLDGHTGSVFANDDVSIGNYSYIMGRVLAGNANGGAGVQIGGSATIVGQIDSWGAVNIGQDSVIGGSIFAQSPQQNVILGANVTVGGVIHINNTVPGPKWNPSFKVLSSASVLGTGPSYYQGDWKTNKLDETRFAGGVTAGTATAPETFTYDPLSYLRTPPSFNTDGTYGDQDITSDSELLPEAYLNLIVRAGKTLTVSAGTYHFQNITLEEGANISIASGTDPADVIIQAFESLYTHGDNVLGRVGQAQVVLNIANNVLMTGLLGSTTTIAASLLAYSDTVASVVDIGGNSTILGKVYSAGDVIIGDNVLVPEAHTSVLLGLGAVCMLAKRRRRSRA